MKVTGLLVLMVGIAAALFTVVNTMMASKPSDSSTVGTAASSPDKAMPPVLVPLVVAGAGIAVGSGMLVFGGKGFSREPNPAVRN